MEIYKKYDTILTFDDKLFYKKIYYLFVYQLINLFIYKIILIEK